MKSLLCGPQRQQTRHGHQQQEKLRAASRKDTLRPTQVPLMHRRPQIVVCSDTGRRRGTLVIVPKVYIFAKRPSHLQLQQLIL